MPARPWPRSRRCWCEWPTSDFPGSPRPSRCAATCCNDALKQLEPLRQRNSTDPEIRHEMGRAYLGIAAIHKALGEYAQAADQCRKAIAELDALLAEHPDKQALSRYRRRGSLALADLVAPEQGKEHFVRAVTLWEPLAAKDPASVASLPAAISV